VSFKAEDTYTYRDANFDEEFESCKNELAGQGSKNMVVLRCALNKVPFPMEDPSELSPLYPVYKLKNDLNKLMN